MQANDFYGTTKHCPSCAKDVRYLSSIDASYCVECGSEVRLLSSAEWSAFQASLEARKNKGGRPRTKSARAA